MPPEDPESIPSLFPGGGDVPASRKDAAEPKPAAARRSRFARGLARRVGAGLPSPVRAGARALLGRRKDHSEQEQQQSSGAPEQTSSGPSSPDRTSRTIGGALRPQPDKASAPAAASSRVDPRSSAASKQRTSSRDSWAPTGGEPRAGASLASIPHTGHLPDLPGTPTYLLPPAHTRRAREILGPDKRINVVLPCCLCEDPAAARKTARRALGIYMPLPAYQREWIKWGFEEADWAQGGSDRLIDGLVGWGDEAAIRARIAEHEAAGASHVAISAYNPAGGVEPDWKLLEALAG